MFQNVFDLIGSSWGFIATTFGAGCIGAIAEWLRERYLDERTMSQEKLFERLKSNTLRRIGISRLEKYADEILERFRQELEPPGNNSVSISWPSKQAALIRRDIKSSADKSSCPQGSTTDITTPLFLRIQASCVEDLKDKGQSVSEIHQTFQRLCGSNKEDSTSISAKLIRTRKYSDQQRPRVWVQAPELLIKDATSAADCLRIVSESIRHWLPAANVVLEVYLSHDIFEEVNGSELPTPNENSVQDIGYSSPAALYAFWRSKALRRINKGIMLGELPLQNVQYQTPEEMLERRLNEKFQKEDRDPKDWSVVTISGPPGVGKTETANLLGHYLEKECKSIVLTCSDTTIFLQALTEGSTSRENLFKSLSELFAQVNTGEFAENENAKLGFGEALFQAMLEGKQEVVLIVDDLDYNADLRKALMQLERKGWNLRFILVGRAKIEGLEKQLKAAEVKTLHFTLWDQDDAKSMIESWEEMDVNTMNRAFATGWLSQQVEFSWYLIKVISLSKGTIEENPHNLLKNAIEDHLKFIPAMLSESQVTSAELFHQLEKMAANGYSASDVIDHFKNNRTRGDKSPIQLFGTLSWASKFKIGQDWIDTRMVIEYSEGRINTLETAREFLKAGENSNIFKKSERGETYKWHDKLISDCCAAFYLNDQLRGLNDATIATMLESAIKPDFVSTLNLILDSSIIGYIVKAVINSHPRMLIMVDKIVTPEFVARRQQSSTTVNDTNNIASAIIHEASDVPVAYIAPLGWALSRLMSTQVEQWCNETLRSGSAGGARLALSVKAAQWQNKEDYFSLTAHYGNDISALEVAAWMWNKEGAGVLYRHIIQLSNQGYSNDTLKDVWFAWIARVGIEGTVKAIRALVESLQTTPAHERFAVAFADSTLRQALFEKSRPSQQYVEELQSAALSVNQAQQEGMASVLIKWVAYCYGRPLVNTDVDWIISQDRQYALPRQPSNPCLVGEVFDKLSTYSKFALPESQQLQHPGLQLNGDELVRDNLPPNFTSGTLTRGDLCVWNGQRRISLGAAEVQRVQYSWRPVLNLW